MLVTTRNLQSRHPQLTFKLRKDGYYENEKIVFLVFLSSDELGQASADFTFNYVSNDEREHLSLLNTASTGNGTLRSLAVIFLV